MQPSVCTVYALSDDTAVPVHGPLEICFVVAHEEVKFLLKVDRVHIDIACTNTWYIIISFTVVIIIIIVISVNNPSSIYYRVLMTIAILTISIYNM